jgi:hypothetical protein
MIDDLTYQIDDLYSLYIQSEPLINPAIQKENRLKLMIKTCPTPKTNFEKWIDLKYTALLEHELMI